MALASIGDPRADGRQVRRNAKGIPQRLAPRLQIAYRCSFIDNFVVVRKDPSIKSQLARK
jgi:hypothetical protein